MQLRLIQIHCVSSKEISLGYFTADFGTLTSGFCGSDEQDIFDAWRSMRNIRIIVDSLREEDFLWSENDVAHLPSVRLNMPRYFQNDIGRKIVWKMIFQLKLDEIRVNLETRYLTTKIFYRSIFYFHSAFYKWSTEHVDEESSSLRSGTGLRDINHGEWREVTSNANLQRRALRFHGGRTRNLSTDPSCLRSTGNSLLRIKSERVNSFLWDPLTKIPRESFRGTIMDTYAENLNEAKIQFLIFPFHRFTKFVFFYRLFEDINRKLLTRNLCWITSCTICNR